MATPDAIPYLDLVLSEPDPQDIIDQAVTHIQTHIPEWQPREGNIEMLLLEAMGVQVAELIYAINQLPSSVVQILLRLNGIEFNAGVQPTATLRFHTVSTEATIPEGTAVALNSVTASGETLVLVTTEAATAAPGSHTVDVSAVGNLYTDNFNGYPVGTRVQLLDSLIDVEYVELATAVVDGQDPESDDAYFQRGIQRFGRLSDALVLPIQFQTFMLEQDYVARALVIDNYNSDADPDDNGPTGSDYSHITVVPHGEYSALTVDEKADLMDKLEELSSANLTIHMRDPDIVPVDVTASIAVERGYVASDVIENVQKALTDYLSIMKWDWSTTVRRNNLVAVMTAVAGVSYVSTLTIPTSDLSLNSLAPLAVPGTLNITVA